MEFPIKDRLRSIGYYLLVAAIVIAIIILAVTVFRSGYFYMLDSDEIFHSQVVYLIAQGYKPFNDFYIYYSPVYHWFLIPFFNVLGFSFATVRAARGLMIGLFIFRIIITYLLFSKLFGKFVSLIFVLLYLLDPFTVFVAMQIRPDNLMMLFLVLSMFLFYIAVSSRIRNLMFISGLFSGLTVLTSIKIIPTMTVMLVGMGIYFFVHKKWKYILRFLVGLVIPLVLFYLWSQMAGVTAGMIQDMLVDAWTGTSETKFPVPLGNYHHVENIFIYGLPGFPVNWIYTWVLLLSGFIGAFGLLKNQFILKIGWKETMIYILCISLLAQFSSLFFIHVVFIQYYLPVNWLLSIFAAFGIVDFTKSFISNKIVYFGLVLLIIALGAVFWQGSLAANIARSKMNPTDYENKINHIWSIVPPNAKVFQNILFRPISFVLPTHAFYGDMPESVKIRFGLVKDYLYRDQVEYLVLDDFYLSVLDPDTQQYVRDQYQKIPGETEIYKKTK